MVNDSNDDLNNPNEKERTKDEEYSTKSVQVHETITKALSTLMNRSEMKRLMKERYIEKHNKDENFDFSFSHFPSIDRASIRKIYASVAKQKWDQILKLDSNLVPARLKLDQVLIDLYESKSLFSRQTLLDVVQNVPFSYGVWHGLKSIYRKSIEDGDWEFFAAFTARIEK